MPRTNPLKVADGRGRKARWGRLLDSLLPAPDADRLVRVGEVSRTAVPLAEGSLADVSVTPVIQETRSMNGDPRFVVLVPARQAHLAKEALAGL
jgi:hypothetical protein